ncbi:protein of unknown function [Bradyrhizobium sp. ORS 285]|nr:protein of unknown function [Bradyrhizobium sp. ORS 285]
MRWPRELAALPDGGADERSSCGREVAWSWRPDAGVKVVTMQMHRMTDGGYKPDTEESAI